MKANIRRAYFFNIILLTVLFLFHSSSLVRADSMESSKYRIQYTNTNITSGNKSSSNYNISDTVGQLAAGQFSSSGYVVKAGFQYWHSITPFRFTISNININLGTLTAQTAATGTTNLTVSFGGAGQYQVTGEELGPLASFAGNQIPDTSCNSSCTETSAGVWSSATAYGFGYNMTGNDIPADFVGSTYYRPFPNRNASEAPSVVMTSANVGTSRQSTVTFRANVSPIQQAGSYQTVVNFIATPSF